MKIEGQQWEFERTATPTLARIKEKKWRDLYWCMEDSPAHGFGCH